MDEGSEECREVYLSSRAAKPGVGLGTRAEGQQEDRSVLWMGLNYNTPLF